MLVQRQCWCSINVGAVAKWRIPRAGLTTAASKLPTLACATQHWFDVCEDFIFKTECCSHAEMLTHTDTSPTRQMHIETVQLRFVPQLPQLDKHSDCCKDAGTSWQHTAVCA